MHNHLLIFAFIVAGPLAACESKAPQRHAQRASAGKATKHTRPASAKAHATKPAAPAAGSTAPDPSARPAGWATGPMSTLLPFAQKLARSAQRTLIEGKTPAAAFAPFEATIQPKLRSELATVKARALELMGMELELVFREGDKVRYYFRTFVFPTKGGPEFFKIDGRAPPTAKLAVPHWPLSAFSKSAPELAQAAEGLAGLLQDGRCKLLPIVSPQTLEGKIKPGPMQLSFLSKLHKATLLRQETCNKLPKLQKAELRMRVDDFALLVLGEKDQVLGTLHGELSLDKGQLKVQISRLRLFP